MIFCNIVQGSFNAGLFGQFIEGLLDKMNPFPAPNSVVIMDNCRIHKAPEIIEMIEARYVMHSCPSLREDFIIFPLLVGCSYKFNSEDTDKWETGQGN